MNRSQLVGFDANVTHDEMAPRLQPFERLEHPRQLFLARPQSELMKGIEFDVIIDQTVGEATIVLAANRFVNAIEHYVHMAIEVCRIEPSRLEVLHLRN